jgi:hypothetical protein
MSALGTGLCRRAWRQHGVGHVEWLVGGVLGLSVLAIGGAVFLAIRLGLQLQQGVAELQDDSRVALNRLGRAVEMAGWIAATPRAHAADAAPEAPAEALPPQPVEREPALHFDAGQVIAGASAPDGDMFVVRFFAAPGAAGLPCPLGGHGKQRLQWQGFRVRAGALQCFGDASGKPRTLLGETDRGPLRAMHLLYGIDLNGDGAVNRYMAASEIVDWRAVRSVRVELVLDNPASGLPGQARTLVRSRVFALGAGALLQGQRR